MISKHSATLPVATLALIVEMSSYWRMGMNPYRPHRASKFDVVFVVLGLLVAAALVAWALLG